VIGEVVISNCFFSLRWKSGQAFQTISNRNAQITYNESPNWLSTKNPVNQRDTAFSQDSLPSELAENRQSFNIKCGYVRSIFPKCPGQDAI